MSVGKEWFVRKDSTISIYCFDDFKNKKYLSRHFKNAIFDWYYEGSEGAILGQRKILFGNGSLRIEHVNTNDSGSLVCSAELVERAEKKAFLHTIIVYRIADVTRVYPFVYTVPTCDTRVNIKQSHLLQKLCEVMNTSMKLCPFRVYVDCFTPIDQKDVTLRLTVEQRPEKSFEFPHCSASCLKKALLKHLQLGEKVINEVSTEEDKDKETGIFKDFHFQRQELMHAETYIRCRSGFQNYRQVMCVPCYPGTFSHVEDSRNPSLECIPCDYGTFQKSFASDHCERCEEYGQTTSVGSNNSVLCYSGKKRVLRAYILVTCIFITGVMSSLGCLVKYFVSKWWRNRQLKKQTLKLLFQNDSYFNPNNSNIFNEDNTFENMPISKVHCFQCYRLYLKIKKTIKDMIF